MPRTVRAIVGAVESVNKVVGKFSMYLVFGMMGILLFESISRTLFDAPRIWTVEMAQFTMAAYYLLGGAYSMMMDGHVRMDLLYGSWSPRRRALADVITGPLLIFYLIFLLVGAISSIEYALEYGQHKNSVWGPPLAPIKIIMGIGILLMLLQAVVTFIKDVSIMRGGSASNES